MDTKIQRVISSTVFFVQNNRKYTDFEQEMEKFIKDNSEYELIVLPTLMTELICENRPSIFPNTNTKEKIVTHESLKTKTQIDLMFRLNELLLKFDFPDKISNPFETIEFWENIDKRNEIISKKVKEGMSLEEIEIENIKNQFKGHDSFSVEREPDISVLPHFTNNIFHANYLIFQFRMFNLEEHRKIEPTKAPYYGHTKEEMYEYFVTASTLYNFNSENIAFLIAFYLLLPNSNGGTTYDLDIILSKKCILEILNELFIEAKRSNIHLQVSNPISNKSENITAMWKGEAKDLADVLRLLIEFDWIEIKGRSKEAFSMKFYELFEMKSKTNANTFANYITKDRDSIFGKNYLSPITKIRHRIT